MKTLLVLSSDSRSLLHYRQEFLKRLQEKNIRVIVCAPPDSSLDLLSREFAKLKIQVFPLKLENTKTNPWADLISLFRLYRLIKRQKIDGIFCYHMKPVVYGSLLGRMAGLDNIYSMITGLGYTFTETKGLVSLFKRALLKKMLLFSLSFNKRVFFQNRDDHALICTSPRLQSSAVLINGSGVNIEGFPLTPPPKELSFLFVGRLLIHKGIQEYVAAARILKQKYPHVSFKIAGGIHPNPASISEFTLKGWVEEGNIEYLGNLETILPQLQACSVCVLPSYREGCPRAVLEALAVGRAVITTDAPGCRDTVIDQDNGYLVPIKDTDALVEAMEKLIKTPSLVQVMGLKSRRRAQEKFDVHKVNKKVIGTMDL